jgi:hypothetical protein
VTSFAEFACEPAAQLTDLLLAAEGELRPGPALATLDRLEALAASLVAHQAPEVRDQARLMAEALGLRACLRAAVDGAPQRLLLTRALLDGRAHPRLLVAIYADVARRAGWAWRIAACQSELLIVHPEAQPSGATGAARLRTRLRILCPHEVTFLILDVLSGAYERHLDVWGAIRACELQLDLPVVGCCRERARLRLFGLRAALN